MSAALSDPLPRPSTDRLAADLRAVEHLATGTRVLPELVLRLDRELD